MSDFRVKIIADLDTNGIESKLANLTKDKKVDLAVDVAIKNAQALSDLEKQANRVAKIVNGKKIGLQIDDKQATTALKQIEKETSKAYQQIQKQREQFEKSQYNAGDAYKQAYQSIGNKSDIQKQMSDYYKQVEKEAAKAYQKVQKQREQWNKDPYNSGSAFAYKQAYQSIGTQSKELQQMKAYYQQVEKEALQVQKIKSSISEEKFNYNNSKNQSFLDKYVGQDSAALNKAKQQIKEVSTLQNELLSGKLEDSEMISKYEQLNSVMEKLGYTMRTVSSEQSKSLKLGEASIAGNKIKKYYEENTRLGKDYISTLKEMEVAARNATTVAEKNKVMSEFNTLKSQLSAEGLDGKSWTNELKRGFFQISQFVGVYGILQRGLEITKQMAKSVLDVDTAMTELRKVSNASESQLSNYFDTAIVSAKKYGATVDDVITSTADWSRLGYDLKDATLLSDATTMLQRVGDNMTQESSSQGLISILKGFSKKASDVNSVIDIINEVANTQPIDTSGIVDGLQRSASSLSAAGNTIEESISMITAANSVVQDPDSVGTAFKTMSMRIRGATTELEEAGLETDGMAESTAKLQEEMKALSGIDIMLNKDTFKSTYQIMDELADKWHTLTDIQQASVTELIAGKRQGNIMSALMSNWDIAEETLSTSFNADGSAEKELKNYQKSLQYSVDNFKVQFQELSNVAFDSDFLKGATDAGTGFLNVLTQIIDVGGGIPALLAAIGGIKLFQSADLFYLKTGHFTQKNMLNMVA